MRQKPLGKAAPPEVLVEASPHDGRKENGGSPEREVGSRGALFNTGRLDEKYGKGQQGVVDTAVRDSVHELLRGIARPSRCQHLIGFHAHEARYNEKDEKDERVSVKEIHSPPASESHRLPWYTPLVSRVATALLNDGSTPVRRYHQLVQTGRCGVTDSKMKTALVIGGPVLLAVGYLWGVVYHDVRMGVWGFRSYAISLSPQDVYIQAFLAAMSVLHRPVEWLNALPLWLSLVVLFVTVAVGCLIGWLSMSPRLLRWRDRWRARIPTQLPERWQRTLMGGAQALGTVLFWPVVLLMTSVLAAFAIAPPYFAARADASRDWDDRAFEKWDQATWITSEGEKRIGYVHSCSDAECALLDSEGDPYTVARDQVGDRRGTPSSSRGSKASE